MNRLSLKFFSLLGVLLILLIPSAPLLAQDATQPIADPCDPNAFINEFMASLNTVQSLPEAMTVFSFAANKVIECWEPWLNLLITSVMGQASRRILVYHL